MTTALALPASPNASGFFWQHQDADGIAAAAARGMKRASSKDWTSGTSQDRARDFRGWLVARAWVAGCLAGTVTMQGESGPLLIANDYPADPNDRARAARALGTTQALLARLAPDFDAWEPPRALVTGASDTGFPIVAVAVIALSVAVASVALAYCGNYAAQVVDNYLARNQAAAELVQADAQVLAVLDKHVARETATGAALPFDDSEKTALVALEQRQQAFTQRATTTPGIKPDSSGWLLPLAIAAGVGAVLFLKK